MIGNARTGSALLWQLLHDGIQLGPEAHVQQPVCLIKDKDFQALQVHGRALLHDVKQPSRRADQHVGAISGELGYILRDITAQTEQNNLWVLASKPCVFTIYVGPEAAVGMKGSYSRAAYK